jgi:hypothetical protein
MMLSLSNKKTEEDRALRSSTGAKRSGEVDRQLVAGPEGEPDPS